MGLQTFQQAFPSPPTKLVNTDGTQTKDGQYLWLALWNRTGQSVGTPKIAVGLTAAATFALAQKNALIAADWNEFDTVASGGICAVPIVNVGSDFIVWNFGGFNLAIAPDPTQQIDALGLGAAYSLAQNKMQWFRCTAQNQLRSMQLG